MSNQMTAVDSDNLPAEIIEQMRRGLHDARGTMAPETERAMRRAFGAFRRWSAARGTSDLPADQDVVAIYVDDLAAIPGRKAAGISQAVWAIGAMHRLAKQPDPTKAEPVRLALKRMSRQLGTRQQQAAPIGAYEVRRITEQAGARPADLRNQALLLMMRDLLARRSEVVALDVADIAYDRDGSGIAIIRRSKTDQTGEGVELYVSPAAVTVLRRWLAAAGIQGGAIFRTVNKSGAPGTASKRPRSPGSSSASLAPLGFPLRL